MPSTMKQQAQAAVKSDTNVSSEPLLHGSMMVMGWGSDPTGARVDRVGHAVGSVVGDIVSASVGDCVTAHVGISVGSAVGSAVGSMVGHPVGDCVVTGASVATSVGGSVSLLIV